MRRRKNFFGSKVKYVVYVYPYTKKHARGDRNIVRIGSFSDEKRARRIAGDQIALGYPEVEVVAEYRGGHSDIVYAARGDRYASMAANPRRNRRNGRGRQRRNPLETPYGGNASLFQAEAKKHEQKAMSEYRGIITALNSQDAEDVPGFDELREVAAARGVVIASLPHADLPRQAQADLTPAKLADQLLALDKSGKYDDFSPFKNKYKEIFDGPRSRLIEQIKAARRKAGAKQGAATKRKKAAISQSQQQDALRARKAELLAEHQELSGKEITPEPTRAKVEQVYEEQTIDHDREAEARRRKTVLGGVERLGRHVDFRAKSRRRDIKPPTDVLAEAQQDVLLYWLTDGSTQVWSKGSLTETFLPFKRKSSLKIAFEYAQSWRGLDDQGKLKPRAKKSRLRSRILTAVQGDKGYEIAAPAISMATASREVTKKLDDVTLAQAKKILKINPRRLTNGSWERQSDGSYYSGGQGASYMVMKERVLSRNRRVTMWALYTFQKAGRDPDTQWRLSAHYRTLAEAKKAAAPLRGIGKLGYNPRRRKNTSDKQEKYAQLFRDLADKRIDTLQLDMKGVMGGGTNGFRDFKRGRIGKPKRWSAGSRGSFTRVSMSIVPLNAQGKTIKRGAGAGYKLWLSEYDDGTAGVSASIGDMGILVVDMKSNPRNNPHRPDAHYGQVKGTLPSEFRGGKPGHDEDFVFGYRAGQAALKRKRDITITDIKARYRKVSKKHGSWWIDGFRTAVEMDQGIATGPSLSIAQRLGLVHGRFNPKRRKNTRFEDHTESPYHRVLLRQGMKYSHSVPVTHQGTKVPHHVYRLGNTDFYTSFYTRPGSGVSVWEGSVSGSGRMHQGKGAQELDRYLKGAVKRHQTKAANPRRRKNTRDAEIFFYSDEKQLYAVRSDKWYRLSMPRSREVFGKEAVEHILGEPPGDISTYISQEHWKYLLPKEVPHSRHGPDETAHYRNPNPRRKNAGKKPTYAAARIAVWRAFGDAGWTLSSPNLKVLHATYGKTRLWFKAQAILVEKGGSPWRMGSAHTLSYGLDLRQVTNYPAFVRAVQLRL